MVGTTVGSQDVSGRRRAGDILGSVPQAGRPPVSKRLGGSVNRDRPGPPGSRVRSAGRRDHMAGPAASMQLTAAEVRKLSAWVRAGTTPQRLVRRARLILGSAAGLGSRALAPQEQMSRTTVRRWLAPVLGQPRD